MSSTANDQKAFLMRKSVSSRVTPRVTGHMAGRFKGIRKTVVTSRKKITIDHHKTESGKRSRRVYAIASILILVATTIFWAGMSAQVHSANADQLVDPYLFESWSIFQGAAFPGAHTFLLKWPLFWLVSLFGSTEASLSIATVMITLATVLGLAAVLYKIERRPLVFGTICLLMALVLLLIPAQPYAGALLPLNMGMLATRNLEYIVYILSLILIIRTRRLLSWEFGLSLVALSILIASDKLFLGLSLGGACLMTAVYWFVHNRKFMALSLHWLFVTVVSAGVSAVLLAVIAATKLTHIVSDGAASPFGLVSNIKDLALGSIYGLLGLATNLGANPAYDATIVQNIPARLAEQLFSVAGLAYVIVITAMVYALRLIWRLMRSTIPSTVKQPKKPQQAKLLAIMLIFSTIVSIGLFVITRHYYPVDARYMTIVFFTIFIVIAVGLRQRKIKPLILLAVGALLSLGIMTASYTAVRTYNHEIDASQEITGRNVLVADVLARHRVSTLVADYWRGIPIRALSKQLKVMPLAGCSTGAQVLTSAAWQPDLRNTSFAYLLTLEHSNTGYPDCSIDQVLRAYGEPNSSLVIKGKVSDPKELLLFYDHGMRASPVENARLKTPLTSAILPINPADLEGTHCSEHSLMNIVAHEDDDLLFMSPDLIHTVQAGDCIRTVYLTAGDAGQDTYYWLGRQLGAQAAYNAMYGKSYSWSQRIVRLGADQYVTVASPRNNPNVSLIFLNLPDGNVDGSGFGASRHESLGKLFTGKIPAIHTVDGHSSYTSAQLKTALRDLMAIYQPDEIRTQGDVSEPYSDHSDHVTTGMFAGSAHAEYNDTLDENTPSPSLSRYMGYPIHGYDSNVEGDDLQQKQAAFFAYALFDNGVCHSIDECVSTAAYGSYLDRQYQQD